MTQTKTFRNLRKDLVEGPQPEFASDTDNEDPKNRKSEKEFAKKHVKQLRRYPAGTEKQFTGGKKKADIQPDNRDKMDKVNEDEEDLEEKFKLAKHSDTDVWSKFSKKDVAKRLGLKEEELDELDVAALERLAKKQNFMGLRDPFGTEKKKKNARKTIDLDAAKRVSKRQSKKGLKNPFKLKEEDEDLDEGRANKDAADRAEKNMFRRISKKVTSTTGKAKEREPDKYDAMAKRRGVTEVLNDIVAENESSTIAFENNATADIDVDTASALLKIHDVLSEENRTKFLENIAKSPDSFKKMVDFSLENLS